MKHSGDHVVYINGLVRETPMPGAKHGKVGFRIAQAIGNFADAHEGRTYAHGACLSAYDRSLV